MAAAFFLTAGLGAFPLAAFGSDEIIAAAVAGALLSTTNIVAGFLAIEYSFERSYTTFLKVVLGGMGVRMLIMLVALAVLIKIFGFHAAALTISLLGFYAVYLVLEVLFIQKKLDAKNQS